MIENNLQPQENQCFHCGNDLEPNTTLIFNNKKFCCLGCQTVYEILSENNLEKYYTIEKNPGIRPEEISEKYHFLENEKIVEKLVDFNDSNTQIVSLYIPNIHCSSCIWVLENLQKINRNIIQSVVNFPKKSVRISYFSNKTSLKEIVLLLSHLGYAPYISLDDYQKKETNKQDYSLLYKLGVAGFAFGNVMLLQFPEYFENDEYWLNQYKYFFRWLSFVLSFPVLLYSASDYFISAYKGLKNKLLNIDIPLALGILAMFIRSFWDIVTDSGQGFFDSLNGLVFFLLVGRFFQQKTYNFLSFERDYKSYFPIGITKINPDGSEESIQIYDIKKGDRLLIRNEELIPSDAILVKGDAHIDYSFVTGETKTIEKISGDKLFAGGKQKGKAIEIEAIKSVSQSYLTQLWSNEIFQKDKFLGVKNLTDTISKYFTISILAISIMALIGWSFISLTDAFNVFTAILIIACPCALAMSAPFALGNTLRIFGQYKFYLKDTRVIEQLSKIDAVIFDKTGTITSANQNKIRYEGTPLSKEEEQILKQILRNSNHPLSRQIYQILTEESKIQITNFEEVSGKGIQAFYKNMSIKIGSASFVGVPAENSNLQTAIFISFNGIYKGKFLFENFYRKGISNLFKHLSKNYEISVLSGDNNSEQFTLEKMLPKGAKILFNQKPNDKLKAIEQLQQQHKKVLMAGDGLNDAGALKQSDVGISVSENVNVFSPACDGIIDANSLKNLHLFLILSKKSIQIIKRSFVISLLYNTIGVTFAITNNLSPVAAAILMPMSSISIVLFTTISTNLAGKILKNK